MKTLAETIAMISREFLSGREVMITAPDVVKLAGVSRYRASRALQIMVINRWLTAHAGGRIVSYTALPLLGEHAGDITD